MPDSLPGSIVLIGSGELSDSMAETHRQLMARLNEPPRPVFLDTPAGFELNIDLICEKATAYFKRHFALDLSVARYRKTDMSPTEEAAALMAVQNANYILAGPGSPSYALRAWRNSRLWRAVVERWRAGSMVVFASAAALTLGAHTIPVYEIYKVGDPPAWMPGLNLLGELGILAAVVPHWNNTSGDGYDTRFCFMGAPRFAILESQIPDETTIIGLDEYTALCIEARSLTGDVLGAGQVTIRQAGRQMLYERGQTCDLSAAIRNGPAAWPTSTASADPAENQPAADEDLEHLCSDLQGAFDRHDFQAVIQGLVSLSLIAGADLEQGVFRRAEQAVQALQSALPRLVEMSEVTKATGAEHDALLALLVEARDQMRRLKQWHLADALRDRLLRMGYRLSDTPDGTQWMKSGLEDQ